MKRDAAFIQHIDESIGLIQEYTRGIAFEDFATSKSTQDSTIRRFQIIGEASKYLSREIKKAYPAVPWKNMAGMRDIVIHNYFGIDLKTVWDTIQNDLPVLEKDIKKIIKEMGI